MGYSTSIRLDRTGGNKKALLREVKLIKPELAEEFRRLLNDDDVTVKNFFSYVAPVIAQLSAKFRKTEFLVTGTGASHGDVWVRKFAQGQVYIRELDDQWKPETLEDPDRLFPALRADMALGGNAAGKAQLDDLKIVKWSERTERFDPEEFETLGEFLALAVPDDVFGCIVVRAEDGRWYSGSFKPEIERIEDPELLKQLEAEDDETELKDEGDETTDGK